MSNRRRTRTRAEPIRRSADTKISYLCSPEAYETLCVSGYTSLAHNPEIVTCVDRIAKLISSMTIQLMENSENGDKRVFGKLSEIVDINPNPYLTRATFIHWIVKTMLLEGDGNAVVMPGAIATEYNNGINQAYPQELNPIPQSHVSFIPDGAFGYRAMIDGVEYAPNSILHFVANPDSTYPWRGTGYRVALRDIADNLKQALATEKGFMSSKWKPSIIVKVDALTEEFASKDGRKKLLDDYINTNQAGEPWMIPADQFQVQEVRPLSLADLALNDVVQLNKKTVASILGVPAFVLGVGEYNKDQWNNFISTTIMPIAKNIEQELSRKLCGAGTGRDRQYFTFNSRSLYSYSITEMVSAGAELVDRMAMRRNEWRDWVGLPPDAEMDELLALENYIPADRLGDQSKLTNGGGED